MINEKWDQMSDSEYLLFTQKWIQACNLVLKNNGSVYVCGTFHNIGEIIIVLKRLGFLIKNIRLYTTE